jgi:hypothetical protein
VVGKAWDNGKRQVESLTRKKVGINRYLSSMELTFFSTVYSPLHCCSAELYKSRKLKYVLRCARLSLQPDVMSYIERGTN